MTHILLGCWHLGDSEWKCQLCIEQGLHVMRAQNRSMFQVDVHSRHARPYLSLLAAFLMKVLVLLMRTGSLDIAQISFYLHFRSLACQQLRWSCRPNAVFAQEELREHLEGYEKWNSFQEAVWVWPSPPMLYGAGHGDSSSSSSRLNFWA